MAQDFALAATLSSSGASKAYRRLIVIAATNKAAPIAKTMIPATCV
jgi:hypothetical protein